MAYLGEEEALAGHDVLTVRVEHHGQAEEQAVEQAVVLHHALVLVLVLYNDKSHQKRKFDEIDWLERQVQTFQQKETHLLAQHLYLIPMSY